MGDGEIEEDDLKASAPTPTAVAFEDASTADAPNKQCAASASK